MFPKEKSFGLDIGHIFISPFGVKQTDRLAAPQLSLALIFPMIGIYSGSSNKKSPNSCLAFSTCVVRFSMSLEKK